MEQFLRKTHQRETILGELSAYTDHPTADELHERIKKKLPRISLATVYRNLEILSEAGVIKKLEISGQQKRFDWDPTDHDHVYCILCQCIDNIAPVAHTAVPRIDSRQKKGYQMIGHRIEFFGICPKCHDHYHTQKGERAMACNTCKTNALSDTQRQVLEALAQSTKACGSKELAEATGLLAKQISCQITALKNKGYVASPARCIYEITEQGKNALI